MTHVVMAKVVATNRATELRNQMIAQRQNSIVGSSSSSIVTWKVHSVKRQINSTPNTLQRSTTLTNGSSIKTSSSSNVLKTNTENYQRRQVNSNIRKKVDLFENSQVEIIETAQTSKLVNDETLVRQEQNENNAVSTELQNIKLSLKRVRVEPNDQTTDYKSHKIDQTDLVIKRKDDIDKKIIEITPKDRIKLSDKPVKEISAQPIKKQYKTVNVPIKAPALNISVTPWTFSGPIITDDNGAEAEKILAVRRKMMTQADTKERTQPPQLSTDEVVLRPISIDLSADRVSSGASLQVPFPRALDLARHNNRPLWRDVRGVIDSNVCETLDKDARVRQEAKFEMMLSEGSYLNGLNNLHSHYMHNIQKHIPSVLSEKDYDDLFRHVSDVRTASEDFLNDLDQVWQADYMLDGIYDVIIKHTSERFSPYVQYCRSMLEMSKHLAQLQQTNEPFRALLEVLINREGSQRLTLDAFLTAPMQRITKLPLLLKTILDKIEVGTEEHSKCSMAYEAASKIAFECDDVVTEKKRLEELLLVSQEVEFSEGVKSIALVISKRFLVSRANVKHFAFRDKAPKREKLQLILFNDLLLVTKRKSDKLYIVVDHCLRDKVRVREMENPTLYGQEESSKQKKPVVVSLISSAHNRKLDLVVTFKDLKQCKEWLELFASNNEEREEEASAQLIVIEDHEPENDDELPLAIGGFIKLVAELDDGWAEGELVDDGSRGRFMLSKTTRIKTKPKSAKPKKELRFSKNDTISANEEPVVADNTPTESVVEKVNGDISNVTQIEIE